MNRLIRSPITLAHAVKAGLLAAMLALLAGCVYEPYGYVRGDGYYGDAYYGTGYYYDRGYYAYSPYYYDPYPWYGPSWGLGIYYSDRGGHHHHDGHWQDGGHRSSWSRSSSHRAPVRPTR